MLEALNNKNPSVKSETALFLSRSFTKTLPTLLNKKLLKALTGGLLKIVNEPGKIYLMFEVQSFYFKLF